jgi:hypothetical protein
MALEDRLSRRMHGKAILGALQRGSKEQRFFRAMIDHNNIETKTGFFLLLLAYPTHLNLSGGYEQYRTTRMNMLQAYAIALAHKFRHLERVIGIATEPPSEATGTPGSSEDLILFEPLEWTQELEAEMERLRLLFDIFADGRPKLLLHHEEEYPPITTSSKPLNRKQRRAEAARRRRPREN